MKVVTQAAVDAVRDELQTAILEQGWPMRAAGALTYTRVARALEIALGNGDPDLPHAIGCEDDAAVFAEADMAALHERRVHGREPSDTETEKLCRRRSGLAIDECGLPYGHKSPHHPRAMVDDQECVCEGEFVWACGPECECWHHRDERP